MKSDSRNLNDLCDSVCNTDADQWLDHLAIQRIHRIPDKLVALAAGGKSEPPRILLSPHLGADYFQ